jgi:hypothetical protein
MWVDVGFLRTVFCIVKCDSMWNDIDVDNEWCHDVIRFFSDQPPLFFIDKLYTFIDYQ